MTKRFGALDVAVNAAGLGASAAVVDMTLAQWKGVLDVDLTGVFLCCKHEARGMKADGRGGVIVNIASTNATQPGEGLAAYCSAKAGVVMLTTVAAMELAPYGVRVVGVAPGLTATPLTAPYLQADRVGPWLQNIPAGRAAQVSEIAAAVAWLASTEAAYITGETLFVDGGLRSRRYPTVAERSAGSRPQGASVHGSEEGAP